MRLMAVFQIVLLLVTCVVPEGRHLLARSQGCSNDCGCSEESRKAGACCCSGKSTASRQQESYAEGQNPCCRVAASRRQEAECQQVSGCENCRQSKSCDDAESPCCQRSKSTVSQQRPATPEIVACPCGGENFELTVITMPRTRTFRVAVNHLPALLATCELSDQRATCWRLPPESPPPKNLPC